MRKLLSIIALSALLSGVARAEPKVDVISEKFNGAVSTVSNFVNSEIDKTKKFQKENWVMMKADLRTLLVNIGLVKE